MIGLWRRSYPEVVARAHELWTAHRYFAASQEFEYAAHVACMDQAETLMLELAWIARMRLHGQKSELESGL